MSSGESRLTNSIASNLKEWDRDHDWSEDGDEWKGQALLCGVPYETWKQSLIDSLIVPNATGKTVLEIGPGHGRWSASIVQVAKRVLLVDLSSNCIAYCQSRFPGVECHVNDGGHLPADLSSQVDFVWSYDSFVHMDAEVIKSYFQELARVLKPGGRAIIHHANRRFLRLAFLRNWGRGGRKAYRWLSQGWSTEGDGWRSNVSAAMIARLAREAGLNVEDQMQYWNGCGVPRFNDCISVLRSG